MKFVYFGYDFMLPAIVRLIDEGHELCGIFSFSCDNIFNFNKNAQALAKQCGVPFILSPPTDIHIAEFLAQGTEVFLSAGYPYKIPPIPETQAYGINVHPTYLPHGRGLMPIPRIIMGHVAKAAGFTAHKIVQEFDAGDILVQQKFDLAPRESVETYCAKIAMRAPAMLSDLMKNLPLLWKEAHIQNPKEASVFKAPTDETRTLDWHKTGAELDGVLRAFGRFGSFARFDDKLWVVFSADIWIEEHDYKAGEIFARLSREVTMTIKDGFICLKEFYPV